MPLKFDTGPLRGILQACDCCDVKRYDFRAGDKSQLAFAGSSWAAMLQGGANHFEGPQHEPPAQ